jgi:TrmH family RNA methyltransferase
MIEAITSTKNPKVKYALGLRERRDRDATGEFLIEGYRELLRASQAGVVIETLFICQEKFLGTNEPALIASIQKSGAKILTCAPQVFDKLSYRDRPDGLLAIAKQMKMDLSELARRLSSNPLLVVAEAIEKPGNLGTILRSSDAVAADGVIVCDRCTDIYNPNVVRASTGTLFTLPVIEAGGEETLAWLQERKIAIAAATPHAEKEFTDVDLTGPLAIVIGTEQLGLSHKWMEQATLTMRIPMLGVADSLNVATATTLLLYEAIRQRRGVHAT